MDKYIIELLDTNTRVIIPDFGAFIIKQKEPRLIVFNEFLRYNDGLLIDYVAKSENINKDVAKKKVIEYVDKAGKNLTDNNEHLISGLGTLIKESTGKITFEEISEAGKKVSKKKEPKKVTETKEEKKEKTEEIKKEAPEKEDKAREVSKPAAAKPPPEKEISKAPPEEPVEKKAAPTVAKEEAKKEIIVKKEEKPVEKPKEEPKLRPAAYQTTEIRKKKKSNAQIIIWIILILIINAAIISWFVFNDEIRDLLKMEPRETIAAEEEPADQSIEVIGEQQEAAVTEDEVTEEITTDIPQQTVSEPEAAPEIEEESISYSEKKYYIVAGCFRDERNADALVRKLKQKGYDAEKFGKIGNLHAVSYSSFIDRAEAQSQLRRIREEEGQEAWLTYY